MGIAGRPGGGRRRAAPSRAPGSPAAWLGERAGPLPGRRATSPSSGSTSTCCWRLRWTPTAASPWRASRREAFAALNPLLTFRCLSNMPAFHVSVNFDVQGPYFVTYPGAGQLYLALEEAVDALRARTRRRGAGRAASPTSATRSSSIISRASIRPVPGGRACSTPPVASCWRRAERARAARAARLRSSRARYEPRPSLRGRASMPSEPRLAADTARRRARPGLASRRS